MRSPDTVRRDERGAVAIMVGVLASVLFVTAAFVVDLGLARDTKGQAQNAVDASALAAANALYPAAGTCVSPVGSQPPCLADAVSEAKAYASQNFSVPDNAWASCSDAAGLAHQPDPATTCITLDSATQPTRLRVVIPNRELRTGLGALAGVRTITIGARAGVSVSGTPERRCGLCFLSGVDAGNADFTVTPGRIMVNGNLTAGPNSMWSAAGIGVAGTVSGGQFSPPWTQTPALPDPFATYAMPGTTGVPARTNPCGSSGGTGVYGSVDLPNGPCALSPGLYVVVGTWGAKNSTVVTGSGVTLYAMCGTTAAPRPCAEAGETGGYLDFKNGQVSLSAPTSGALAGMAVLYDRGNTQNLSLQGNGGTSITGAVYLRRGTLDFNGNSCFGFQHGPVVANGVTKANGDKACAQVTSSTDAVVPGVPGAVALNQ